MLPDLPESYYHDNVLTLFAHVENLYADLLDDELLGFINRFTDLGIDAQKLYIRLLNRSHEWYRASKLVYPEIVSLDQAIDELERQDCLRVNDPIDMPTLLSLFTKPELVAASKAPELARLRRDELVEKLIADDSDSLFDRLAASDDLLLVQHRDFYQLLQMLFFGNLNQSMTDFVLRDLGLYQFENYRIDAEHRPYRNRDEIEHHWFLHQLEVEFEESDLGDCKMLQGLHESIPDDIDPLAPAWRKGERLRYEIARQVERNDKFELALKLYRRCQLPPSRERITRILDRQGKPAMALEHCARIIDAPIDDTETQFASAFADRLIKRHRLESISGIEQHRITHQPEVEQLELDFNESVELAVAEHYELNDADGQCHYLENSLFNGVLGLLLWEVIFAPLPGAFYNSFQYRPSDFYAHDFCERRARLLQQAWSDIDDNAKIRDVVFARWQQKQGLMNPLVNWQDLSLELIDFALQRIEYAHWRAIFDRILRDLRNNRAGFPDLVHFPSQGGYCLIEVKGPGDQLQKNQRRWMQYFSENDIPHRVTRVKWRES